MAIDPHILDAAADWHVQLEGETPDYDGFAAWLEADARHRDAYDQVIAFDTFVTERAPALAPGMAANDDLPAPRSVRWRWAGVAAAVALVAGTGALTFGGGGSQNIEVATAKGAYQTVQLADASSVTVDGNSAIAYRANAPRAVTLTRGSALFAVRHDAAHPFSVAAGGYQIRDLGTEFAVSHANGHVSISVASGLVDISGPGVTRLALHPGERIDIVGNSVERSKVDPASVGSWRQGRLIYDNAPLQLVVADINRYADHSVVLDPALSHRRFSGVLTIGNGSQLAPTLANLMSIPLNRAGATVRLGAGSTR